MNHSFNVEIASEYGIEEAILLNYFEFWIATNKANKSNFHDGKYWTYNSVASFEELFPYMSKKQIRTALNNIREKGLILTGNYNTSAYDRTLWYSLSDLASSILLKGQIDLPKKANESDPGGKPIPVTNTVTLPVINTDKESILCLPLSDKEQKPKTKACKYKSAEIASYFEIFWNEYPSKRFRSQTLSNFKSKINKGIEPLDMIHAAIMYAGECRQKNCEDEFVKRGYNFIGKNDMYLDYLEQYKALQSEKEMEARRNAEAKKRKEEEDRKITEELEKCGGGTTIFDLLKIDKKGNPLKN